MTSKSKFIECWQITENGKVLEDNKHSFVKLSEIKKIEAGNNKCCFFYLYKDEMYGVGMRANELLKLNNED